jgi:hypothetical protein
MEDINAIRGIRRSYGRLFLRKSVPFGTLRSASKNHVITQPLSSFGKREGTFGVRIFGALKGRDIGKRKSSKRDSIPKSRLSSPTFSVK